MAASTSASVRLIRVNHSGTRDTIVTGLFLPTAIAFGPDCSLYVSNKGFGPPIPRFGEILRVDLHDGDSPISEETERDVQ